MQPLWSGNLVTANGLCGVWGWALALIVRCTSAWEMHLRGQGGVGVSASGLQRVALCCSLTPGPDGRECGWLSGSSGSGAEYPAPQSAGASTEEPPSPRVSAASLRTLRSLCLRPSFFWFCFFISDCCAQDCESEKPLRSRHRCKRTRVYLQAQACVQVHPDTTEQGLGPRSGF